MNASGSQSLDLASCQSVRARACVEEIGMEDILTPEQLANRWGCAQSTVREAIRTGSLKGFRVGRLLRVRERDVAAFSSGESATSSIKDKDMIHSNGVSSQNTEIKSLSPTQLASRWKCSSSAIYNLISSGEVKSFRLGKKILRITHDEVERFEK